MTCPADFLYVHGECYRMADGLNTFTWPDAVKACELHSAYLASPHSVAEARWIFEVFHSLGLFAVSGEPSVWLGINEARLLLPRCYIHATNCGGESLVENAQPSGIDCLEYYHRREENINGIIGEQPVHDEFSHGADALRTLAEAHRLGMIEGSSASTASSRAGSCSMIPTISRGASVSSASISRTTGWLYSSADADSER